MKHLIFSALKRLLPVLAAKGDKFAVGDRVAGNYGNSTTPGEWWLGTVIKAPTGKIGVDYDNGDTNFYPAAAGQKADVVLLDQKTPKNKKSFTTLKLKPYLRSTGSKTTVLKKPAPPVAPPTVLKRNGEDTTRERALLAKLGSESRLYARAVEGSSADKTAWMRAMYVKANRTLFQGSLLAANLRTLKDMGTTFRLRGQWSPSSRFIAISPRLFKSLEEITLATLVHEMCHQAVSEIDKVFREPNRGHGPTWEARMRKVGLDPARYSQYDNAVFMEEHEKVAMDKEKDAALKRVADRLDQNTKVDKISPYALVAGPGKWYDAKSQEWRVGYIVGPNDKAGKRWAFTSNPRSTTSWNIVPDDWFARLSASELAKITPDLPAFQRSAEVIRDHIRFKSNKRSGRNSFRSMLGL